MTEASGGSTATPCPPLVRSGGGAVCLSVELSVYSLPAIRRACYRLTDRGFFLLRTVGPDRLQIFLQARSGGDSDTLLGELGNELLDQQVREDLAKEAGPLRDLIAAQAFAEGNLLDEDRDEGDYRADPRGIGHHL